MQHAYCTECQARVSVRADTCLLGHPIDPETISNTRGRRVARHPQRRPHAVLVGTPGPVTETPPTILAPPVVRTQTPAPAPAGFRLEETRFLIQDLWNTAEHLEEWRDHLVKADTSAFEDLPAHRRVRMVIAVAVVLLGVGWGVFRLLGNQPQTTFDQTRLDESVVSLEVVLADFADGMPIDQLTVPIAIHDVDAVAKNQYAAAATIKDPVARAKAAASAEKILQVTDRLAIANAYQAALGPYLVEPPLPDQPDPDDLATVTEILAVWQVDLEAAMALVPVTDVTATHARAMTDFLDGFQTWKAGYLDAVNNGQATYRQVGELSDRVASLRHNLDRLLRSVADQTRQDLG